MEAFAQRLTRGGTPLAAVLLLTGLLGTGCSTHAHWAALREDIDTLATQRRSVPPTPGYLDLRGAIHVHTELSHDSEATSEELLAGAHEAKLDFVVMTEHYAPGVFDRTLRGHHGRVVVIPGTEIIKGCRGLADRCATLLAFGYERDFDPEPLEFQAVVDEVRRQGGLAFVAHPAGWRDWSVQGVHGLEIYDVLDDVLDRKWKFPKYFFDVIHSWDDWSEQVILQVLDRPDAHLRRWDELTQTAPLAALGGNDAHQNQNELGYQLDPYPLSFRLVTTHVLARSHDAEGVLEALAAGRSYIAFELQGDASGFRFEAHGSGVEAVPGETLPYQDGLALTIQAPLPGHVRLLRNGEPIGECRCRAFRQQLEKPGVYRAEVDLSLGDRQRPWIISNPIYIQ